MFIHAVHLWVVNEPLVRFNVQVWLGVWQGYGYSWVLDSIAKQREVIIFRLVSFGRRFFSQSKGGYYHSGSESYLGQTESNLECDRVKELMGHFSPEL